MVKIKDSRKALAAAEHLCHDAMVKLDQQAMAVEDMQDKLGKLKNWLGMCVKDEDNLSDEQKQRLHELAKPVERLKQKYKSSEEPKKGLVDKMEKLLASPLLKSE